MGTLQGAVGLRCPASEVAAATASRDWWHRQRASPRPTSTRVARQQRRSRVTGRPGRADRGPVPNADRRRAASPSHRASRRPAARCRLPSNAGHSPPTASATRAGETKSPATKPIAMTASRSGDHPLEGPLARAGPGRAAVPVDDDPGDDPAEHERQVEQHVQRDCPAHDLGQVGRHGDRLGLPPVQPAGPARHPVPQRLRERRPRDQPNFGRQVLHEAGRSGWPPRPPRPAGSRSGAPAATLVATLPGST